MTEEATGKMQALPAARRAALASSLQAFLEANSPGLTILYSTSPNWPFKKAVASQDEDQTIDVGVLDSSFNPPTLAHRAIALGPPLLARGKKKVYDAHLLLFSCRNADKGTGKEGDASQLQRISMMELLAKNMEEQLRQESGYEPNIAVGIVEQPLIFAKSTLCHEYVRKHQDQSTIATARRPAVRFHWQAGMDTLERVFAMRYYPSPESFKESSTKFFKEEDTTLVVASRVAHSLPGKALENQDEQAFLKSELVRPWVEAGSVALWQLPQEAQGCSSTAVRSLYQGASAVGDDKGRRELLAKLVPSTVAEYLEEDRVYALPK